MRVSVVIPMLDAEDWIAQAIRSALNQTHPPVEVIVVDNGSTDASRAIAESFAPEVTTLDCARPGASAARALGADAASGDALLFLDADDLLGPTAIAHLTEALDASPDGIALCPWRRYERKGAAWLAMPASCPPRRPDQDTLSAWLSGWYHPPCSVLWSCAALSRAGGWDPAVTVDDDGDLVMRALVAGVPVAQTDRGLAYYRRQPGDAVTLSGRATTPAGLASRLSVVTRIEALLCREGRERRYRAPLAESYEKIARDADGIAPDIRDSAQSRLDANGGHGAVRRLRRDALRRIGRARAAGPIDADDFDPPTTRSPATTEPLVSVVLPTFNREAKLARAVESVRAQGFGNWELLVVDDASTDGTGDYLDGLADPRIRAIRQERNRGVAAARNTGMAAARGDLIAFLDSDDTWMPDKLEQQVDLMNHRGPLVGVVYGGLITRDDHGLGPPWRPEARGNVLARMMAANVVHFGTSSVVIRREVADVIGGFDEDMPANEDHDFWTRAARFFAFDFVPEAVMIYDQTGEDDTSHEKRSRNFAANMRARDQFVSRHGPDAVRLGMRHRYQLDSARRHFLSPEGAVRRGRWLLLKAIRDRPLAPRGYAWLALSALPRDLRIKASGQLGGWRKALLAAPGIRARRS